VVVSRDGAVLATARRTNCVPLRELGRDLNAALQQAKLWAADRRAGGLLILPVDLPEVSGDDIEAVLSQFTPRHAVAAPDRRGQGTNALLVAPSSRMRYAFGPGSLSAHRFLAQAAGLDWRAVERPGLAFDVDTPDDLREFLQLASGLDLHGRP
jgi:2-phospho-L-lactate guanylyltransferase